MSVENLLNPGRSSSSKGPPPAHQSRSDNVPAAHGSSRELRRNSQSSRDTAASITLRNTRGKGSVGSLDNFNQQKSDNTVHNKLSSSSKKRGRPSSGTAESPPGIPGADILDLSSLPMARRGNSLLRSESRSRRGKEQEETQPSVSTRSSSAVPSKSSHKSSSRQHQQQQQSPSVGMSHESELNADKGGRTTRASKRIGSRIDALALNLQAKRMHRSDSPEPSPTLPKEKPQDNHMAAHGSGKSSSSEHKSHSSKAPPAAHSGSQKSSSSLDQQRHRDKSHAAPPPTSSAASSLPSQSSSSTSRQDPLAQFMSKVGQSMPPATSSATGLPGQASSSRQDPLTQLMSNPASLLAGLNPSTLGGAGDIMNQLLRKAGTNDIVKNLLNEFVKNPSLALDPNILATLTASLPMGTQSLPTFNLPTSAATSLPYSNYTNPLANPFLPFSMANLGMNNPLSNPLGLFPNLYMPPRFPTAAPDQQQQSQQQQRQPSNQSGGNSDGSSKDKKMRYPRK